VTTRDRTLRGHEPGPGGYQRLREDAGEPWVVRTLYGASAPLPDGEPLVALAHLSDTHVMDCQSPARVEFIDRYLHPDIALPPSGDDEGRAYRPQEMLTAQVLDAMAQAVATTRTGPLTGRALDLAVVTGDMTDSAQANELQWLDAILGGGQVRADSGDLDRFEGVGSRDWHDPAYWHPDGGPGDVARDRHGFPLAPGLLDAARRPFAAAGLGIPWLAVYGNHDGLVQGTLAISDLTRAQAAADAKAWRPGPSADVATARDLLDGVIDDRTIALLTDAEFRSITPDALRRHLDRAEHVAWHVAHGGHGFTQRNVDEGTAYYRHDLQGVTILALDTVVAEGGWQGSVDEPQLRWLLDELAQADADGRPVVLASHHTAADFINDNAPEGASRRVLREEFLAAVTPHPSVIAWLNGHTHTTRIHSHGSFWEITAPSLIDWPQQGRVVEILRTSDGYAIAVTMLDHAGPAAWTTDLRDTRDLAALSRELSANAWAAPPGVIRVDAHPRAGRPEDRNAILIVRR